MMTRWKNAAARAGSLRQKRDVKIRHTDLCRKILTTASSDAYDKTVMRIA